MASFFHRKVSIAARLDNAFGGHSSAVARETVRQGRRWDECRRCGDLVLIKATDSPQLVWNAHWASGNCR